MGGIGWGWNRLNARVETLGDEQGPRINALLDQNGQPAKVEGEIHITDALHKVKPNKIYEYATRMTDGSWRNAHGEPLDSVFRNADGSIAVSTRHGDINLFRPGQPAEAFSALKYGTRMPGSQWQFADGDRTYRIDNQNVRVYDEYGRLTELRTAAPADGAYRAAARLTYGPDDVVQSVGVGGPNQYGTIMRTGPNSFKAVTGGSQYTFDGKVEVIPPQTGGTEQIRITMPSGAQSTFKLEPGSAEAMLNFVKTSGTYVPGGSGTGYVSVDSTGNNITVSRGPENGNYSKVNGNLVHPGQRVNLKPGDVVQFGDDVGDRAPHWTSREWALTRGADGKLQIGGIPLAPNMVFDLPYVPR